MQRMKMPLKPEELSWDFCNAVLRIEYKKPERVLLLESSLRQRFKEFNSKNPTEGDMEGVFQLPSL